MPAAARAIQGRLEEVLQLIGALLRYVQLQASTLFPLLRCACQSLSAEGVDLLQVKAAGNTTSRAHCSSVNQHWHSRNVYMEALLLTALGLRQSQDCLAAFLPQAPCASLCAGLLVSVFQNSPQLQSQLLEEIVSRVLPSLPGGKRWHKAYVVGSSRSASVQVITAMLIQMIQVCSQILCLQGRPSTCMQSASVMLYARQHAV